MRKLFTLLFALFICSAAICQTNAMTEDENCHASINGKTGEFSMSADMVIRVGVIKCDCKEFQVMSFDMVITANSVTKKYHSESSSITNVMKKIMKKADKVGYVTLANVKVVNTKGDEEFITGLSINLN